MEKNGFTLIELIGVVVILAIIALIAFPATLSVLQNGQNKVDESVKQTIEQAANHYVNDNKEEFKKQKLKEVTTEVDMSTLKEKGYIETDFYDKYKLDGTCVEVSVNESTIGSGENTKEIEKYTFEFKKECNN